MAKNTPFGLQIAQDLSAGYKGGHLKRCLIPATASAAAGSGCAVALAGSADADGNPTVARWASGAIFGVVVGFEEHPNFLEQTHRTASTARYAFVYTDPDALYVIQEDGDGAKVAATDVGANANIAPGTVDTFTGVSGMQLDSSTVANTATLPLKILGLAQGYDEDMKIGDDHVKWLVKINNHQLAGGTGTVGV
jgi:hypothetical protein